MTKDIRKIFVLETSKNCFFGIRLQFLNPHLHLVNSGLKILSALKNQVFRGFLLFFGISLSVAAGAQNGEDSAYIYQGNIGLSLGTDIG
ncbi:MAG: hypothetical protein LBQ70_07615, partial [Prevotellaceae bacterium]|nr:hypothetical protein [Prevotellaceae bacterium]